MGRRLKQIFLQRRRTDGQQPHEKVLSIVHYERNEDRNGILFKTLFESQVASLPPYALSAAVIGSPHDT